MIALIPLALAFLGLLVATQPAGSRVHQAAWSAGSGVLTLAALALWCVT